MAEGSRPVSAATSRSLLPTGIWVMSWRRSTGRATVSYDAIVEEALCFGWIDATINVFDDERRLQLVAPRRPRSTWAPSNKARVARLLAEGRMQPRGLRAVEVAKANGWWDILDDVDAARQETRRRRIDAIVEQAASGKRARG